MPVTLEAPDDPGSARLHEAFLAIVEAAGIAGYEDVVHLHTLAMQAATASARLVFRHGVSSELVGRFVAEFLARHQVVEAVRRARAGRSAGTT